MALKKVKLILHKGMDFKGFLLTEGNGYLSDRVNDVLTGVHELLQARKQMGTRQLVKNAESIANQIRKILHASWPHSQVKYLKVLQKCGVALMKTIDEKGDLHDTFNSVRNELEQLASKLKVPANSLGTHRQEKPKAPEPPPPQANKDQNQLPPERPQVPPETVNQQIAG